MKAERPSENRFPLTDTGFQTASGFKNAIPAFMSRRGAGGNGLSNNRERVHRLDNSTLALNNDNRRI
ncbi:hypothetical protein HMPREF9120_01955 [Neisseria sp. oral taxon 020 str. F0370]|nr:hypothetical protein HMPREF9120_01955 [Neisseria sp. oral taxon 020 str. F0370]